MDYVDPLLLHSRSPNTFVDERDGRDWLCHSRMNSKSRLVGALIRRLPLGSAVPVSRSRPFRFRFLPHLYAHLSLDPAQNTLKRLLTIPFTDLLGEKNDFNLDSRKVASWQTRIRQDSCLWLQFDSDRARAFSSFPYCSTNCSHAIAPAKGALERHGDITYSTNR